jgi:superfamily I DNA/RNA helicase
VKLPTYQDLSKEQDAINNLPLEGTYLVTGPPGTGKTVMALYRARMISERGERVKLLMHGKLLSQYTRAGVEELEIDGAVTTFHSWMHGWSLENWRKPPPQLAPYVHDWPTIVAMAIKKPPAQGTLPYLLVDEGQDMDDLFYVFARAVARQLTVFADENQRITPHQSTLDEIRERIRPDSEMQLTRNYRNTREIAVVAAHFHQGTETGVPELPDRRGPKPVLLAHPRTYESVKQITDYATTFRHQQIGILVPNLNVMTKYLNRLASGLPDGITLQHYQSGGTIEVDFTEPGVTVINWASVKGLEFDVVFIPELQVVSRDLQDPTFLMLLYVLCSRARERLFFSYSGEGRPQIIELFPLDEMEVMV